jgi:hypothetical protein
MVSTKDSYPKLILGAHARDVYLIMTLLVFLLIVGALIENDLLLIVAAIGIFGVAVIQAARNYQRERMLYCSHSRALQLQSFLGLRL